MDFGRDVICLVVPSEGVEDGDRVSLSDEWGAKGHPCAEVGPFRPMAIGGSGWANIQPFSDVFCQSAEATPEVSLGGEVHSRHYSGWGKFV